MTESDMPTIPKSSGLSNRAKKIEIKNPTI
jgi:hypothetical protein